MGLYGRVYDRTCDENPERCPMPDCPGCLTDDSPITCTTCDARCCTGCEEWSTDVQASASRLATGEVIPERFCPMCRAALGEPDRGGTPFARRPIRGERCAGCPAIIPPGRFQCGRCAASLAAFEAEFKAKYAAVRP